MRTLLWIVLLALGLWTGYWFVGANTHSRLVAAWFEARRADGWRAKYSDLGVDGFPYRFDTNLKDIDITDPGAGFGWSAPRFQFLELSYDPRHFMAFWPKAQSVTTPLGRFRLTSRKMEASMMLALSAPLAPKRAILVAEGVTVQAQAGWRVKVGHAQIAARRAPTGKRHYDLAIDAKAVRPPAAALARLDPAGNLPQTVDLIDLDTSLGLTAALNAHTLSGPPPRITSLDLRKLRVLWGPIRLSAEGTLTFDDTGTASGQIRLRTTDAADVIRLARNAGLLTGAQAETAARIVRQTGLSEFTLRLVGGVAYLGPVPIGPAPRLSWR